MAKFTMDMVLEYAKVFEENRDMGGDDNKAAKKAKSHNGQYVVNAYFTDPSQIEELLQSGLDPEPMGHARIKQGNDFGIGKYVKLSRMHDHVMTFTDNKSGKETVVDFGGKPAIVNLTNGIEKKAWWTYAEDGTLGNGTKSKVQFETYSNGAGVRLIALGVTDHVAWEDNSTPSEDDQMFMVG
jgi:hypothetical protein